MSSYHVASSGRHPCISCASLPDYDWPSDPTSVLSRQRSRLHWSLFGALSFVVRSRLVARVRGYGLSEGLVREDAVRCPAGRLLRKSWSGDAGHSQAAIQPERHLVRGLVDQQSAYAPFRHGVAGDVGDGSKDRNKGQANDRTSALDWESEAALEPG